MSRDIEHQHAVCLFRWVQLQEAAMPELRLLFHVPNGGDRNRFVAGKLKAEGVRAGVSDYLLLVARQPYHGLLIELKAPKEYQPRVQANQKEFLELAAEQNFRAEVAYGWEAAKDIIIDYMKGKPWPQ